MSTRASFSTTNRVAGAAALIAVLTVASRLAGFGRTAVFTWSVGTTHLGDIYLAANLVPNVIFEIIAGGALAGLVVPLLAGAAAAGDRDRVAATTSALLTWTLALLLPLAAVVAVSAGPIMAILAPHDASAAQVAAGTRMLRVFAPQLPLYGVGIVLTGVLQAHRRFAWPVLAPLLSSVTVIGTYLAFAVTQGRRASLERAGADGQYLLAVGTTLGVVVLSLCLLIPLRRLRLRLRPALTFPAGMRAAVGGLALAGVVTVGAQQISTVLILKLALAGPEGAMVSYNLAQTVFLLPWAVLAVPLATAAYPSLAAAWSHGDGSGYGDILAATTRRVVLSSFLGAAALVAVARPVADFFVEPAAAPATAAGIAGFAPGLLGYGLFAVLSRALYARNRPGPAAAATAAGWAGVALAAVTLGAGISAGHRVFALGLANSVGMLVLGGLLVVAVTRTAGRRALAGLARCLAVGVLAGGAGVLAGLLVTGWLATGGQDTPTVARSVLAGMLSAAAVGVVFLAVAYPLDRSDVRPMTAAVGRKLRRVIGMHGQDRRTAGGTQQGTADDRKETLPR